MSALDGGEGESNKGLTDFMMVFLIVLLASWSVSLCYSDLTWSPENATKYNIIKKGGVK